MILIARQLFDPIADEMTLALGPLVRSCVIEQWLSGCHICHRVGPEGVDTEIHGNDGTPLLDRGVRIVLNRVRQIPATRYHNAVPGDHAYALAEAMAVFWSCMEGLYCPVINSIRALGLVGCAGHPLAHAAKAHWAGLRTREYRLMTRARFGDARSMQMMASPFPADSHSINAPAWFCSKGSGIVGQLWIVGGQVLGALDGVPEEGALRFAHELGLGFGVLVFEQEPGGQWLWTGVDPLPLHAPPAVLHALAQHLTMHACASRESVEP